MRRRLLVCLIGACALSLCACEKTGSTSGSEETTTVKAADTKESVTKESDTKESGTKEAGKTDEKNIAGTYVAKLNYEQLSGDGLEILDTLFKGVDTSISVTLNLKADHTGDFSWDPAETKKLFIEALDKNYEAYFTALYADSGSAEVTLSASQMQAMKQEFISVIEKSAPNPRSKTDVEWKVEDGKILITDDATGVLECTVKSNGDLDAEPKDFADLETSMLFEKKK